MADKPLGPYTFHGDINNAVGGLHNTSGCTVCMGNPCPAGKCVVPVQLNSIVRDHSGTPLALTGGMWGLNARSEITNILGDYAENWQPCKYPHLILIILTSSSPRPHLILTSLCHRGGRGGRLRSAKAAGVPRALHADATTGGQQSPLKGGWRSSMLRWMCNWGRERIWRIRE